VAAETQVRDETLAILIKATALRVLERLEAAIAELYTQEHVTLDCSTAPPVATIRSILAVAMVKWLKPRQYVMLQADSQVERPSDDTLFSEEFVATPSHATCPRLRALLVQGWAWEVLNDQNPINTCAGFEGGTALAEMVTTLQGANAADSSTLLIEQEAWYRRVAESFRPLVEYEYGPSAPSNKLWRTVTTKSHGWTLEGPRAPGARKKRERSEKEAAEGAPSATHLASPIDAGGVTNGVRCLKCRNVYLGKTRGCNCI
jgi:hypothetical protein